MPAPPPPPGFERASKPANAPPAGFVKAEKPIMSRIFGLYNPLSQAEAALSIGTGMVSAPINEVIAGMSDIDPRGFSGEEIMADPPVGTYQPRSQGGQDIMKGMSTLFSPVGKAIELATSPAGRGILLPHVFPGDVGDLSTDADATSHFARAGVGVAPAVGPLRRFGSARAISPVVRQTAAEATQAATEAAQNYVTNRAGLVWGDLSKAVQDRITEIARDSRALDRLDPEAFKRQAVIESLPEPMTATRGQLTRDPVQLRNEGNVSATTAGRPIREIHVNQNAAILKNLDILRGRTRGRADTPEQVGQSVQGAARAKLELQRKNVKSLYTEAERVGEMQSRVPVSKLNEILETSPDLTHLGWVESWLKKTGVARRDASLKELEDLRQAAVARAMDGGTEGYYAGKVIRALDEATEGAGGQAYARARAARRAQATEFEEQGGMAGLVENRSRTDRAVALEDTWRRTVLGGSIADLTAVKRSLLTGGDAATRTAGRQAWRDLQAQTIQEITSRATRSAAHFEDGSPNVTPAALQQALRAIGPEKLETIFGPGTVKQLDNIMEATRIAKTEPPAGFKGSPTFANTITFLEGALNSIPVIGGTAAGAVRATRHLRNLGESGRVTSAAQQTPIGDALRTTINQRRSIPFRPMSVLPASALAVPQEPIDVRRRGALGYVTE